MGIGLAKFYGDCPWIWMIREHGQPTAHIGLAFLLGYNPEIHAVLQVAVPRGIIWIRGICQTTYKIPDLPVTYNGILFFIDDYSRT